MEFPGHPAKLESEVVSNKRGREITTVFFERVSRRIAFAE